MKAKLLSLTILILTTLTAIAILLKSFNKYSFRAKNINYTATIKELIHRGYPEGTSSFGWGGDKIVQEEIEKISPYLMKCRQYQKRPLNTDFELEVKIDAQSKGLRVVGIEKGGVLQPKVAQCLRDTLEKYSNQKLTTIKIPEEKEYQLTIVIQESLDSIE